MGLAGGYTLVAGSGAGGLKLHISGSSSVACDWRFTGDVGLLSGELWLCNTFAAGGGGLCVGASVGCIRAVYFGVAVSVAGHIARLRA